MISTKTPLILLLMILLFVACVNKSHHKRTFFSEMKDTVYFIGDSYWLYIEDSTADVINKMPFYNFSLNVPAIEVIGSVFVEDSSLVFLENDNLTKLFVFNFNLDAGTVCFENEDFVITAFKTDKRANDELFYFQVDIKTKKIITYDINYSNRSIWVFSKNNGLIDITYGNFVDQNCFQVYSRIGTASSSTICRIE